MTTGPDAPVDDVARVADVESRLLELVRPLGDDDMSQPSRLPGWSVAHLVTHVARNADSHRRRTEAAIAGVVVDQYPGGMSERAAQIEAGVDRSASHITADLAESSARMMAAWTDVPPAAWAGVSRDAGGTERRLVGLPRRRWIEVEVHMVDLGIGPTWHDWPDAFVAAQLPELRDGLAARLPSGVSAPPAGPLDEREELAWLYGRLTRPDLPVLGPW